MLAKKEIGRRGFLRGMMAAPFAGKAAATEVAEKLSGISTAPSAYPTPYYGHPSDGLMATPRTKILKWILQNGIPDWKRKQITVEAKHSARSIEADLASLRSVSLDAKYREQVRRNVHKMEQSMIDEYRGDVSPAEEFSRKHGFWL